jgi:hypothetical protein
MVLMVEVLAGFEVLFFPENLSLHPETIPVLMDG